MKDIDIVYVLGHGSLWDNNELRYSLRSLSNLVYHGQVWVVGERPSWLTNVRHIPFPDCGRNKPENIYRKILKACQEGELTAQFLFMNDDFFIVKPTNPFVPFYTDGTLREAWRTCRNEPYKIALMSTIDAVRPIARTPLHYDIHTPIVYDKEVFKRLMPSFDWSAARCGMVAKSLYANSIRTPFLPYPYEDLKINHPVASINELQTLVGDRFMFSTGEYGINDVMIEYLNKSFPHKSKHEL